LAALMRAQLPALPIEQNDTSSAIRAAFTTMPREDQAALLETLQVRACRKLFPTSVGVA
jgi:hypothetical protein